MSNNKLEVQGDFGEMIKDPKRCTSSDRDIQTRFRDWLRQCHRELDREVSAEVHFMEKPLRCSTRSGIHFFKCLRYGRESNDVWREGQKVRIVLNGDKATGGKRKRGSQQANAGSDTSGRMQEHLGLISHFEIDPGEGAGE